MAIFLGVSAAPKQILLSKISYAPVQHSLSQPESFIVQPEGAADGLAPAEDSLKCLLLLLVLSHLIRMFFEILLCTVFPPKI